MANHRESVVVHPQTIEEAADAAYQAALYRAGDPALASLIHRVVLDAYLVGHNRALGSVSRLLWWQRTRRRIRALARTEET